MSDEGVRKMAKLLSAGATMLSKSCPDCGSPLFKLKDGKMLCASCGYSPDHAAADKRAAPEHRAEEGGPADELNGILKGKLSLMVGALKEAKDPNEIKSLVSCIRDILALLEEK
jgi:UPF0148 protein